jgi:GT2 family glycosyltransferase
LDRDIHVIVVDNDSQDGSLETIFEALTTDMVSSEVKRPWNLLRYSANPFWPEEERVVLLVQAEKNGGYAYGNNIGLRIGMHRTTAEFFWILNSDTVIPSETAFDALVDRMDESPKLGICGSTVVYLGKPHIVQTRAGGRFDPVTGRTQQIGCEDSVESLADRGEIEKELAYINGAAAFVRRSMIDDIGYMDEGYFLYFEEIDWAQRCLGKYTLGYAPNSTVLHQVGGAIGTNDTGLRSAMSDYYLTKSKFRFLARHSRRSIPAAILDLARELKAAFRRRRFANLRAIAKGFLRLPFGNS